MPVEQAVLAAPVVLAALVGTRMRSARVEAAVAAAVVADVPAAADRRSVHSQTEC